MQEKRDCILNIVIKFLQTKNAREKTLHFKHRHEFFTKSKMQEKRDCRISNVEKCNYKKLSSQKKKVNICISQNVKFNRKAIA